MSDIVERLEFAATHALARDMDEVATAAIAALQEIERLRQWQTDAVEYIKSDGVVPYPADLLRRAQQPSNTATQEHNSNG